MKRALIVGINDYPRAPLSGCINDAKAIANILERNGDDSTNFSIRMELDVKVKGKLKGAIRDCFAGDEDVALFYFSGHGFIDAIGGYIVTPDFSENDWGVSMQDILEIVNQSKCRSKVVILDCCHSGFMGNITASGQTTAVIKEGVTILTASKHDAPAMETERHGVFTSLLLEALNGGAADVTGNITPGGIYAYIDRALGPWKQRPVFKTNVTRFLPLRTVKPHIDISVLRRIIEYFAEPYAEYALDPSYEFTNALNVEHNIVEPYAKAENVAIFKNLQKLESIGLVVPCGEDHMYFAAMKSKKCKLTTTGQYYWQLVKDKIL
jgi:uncharacterized caspase-like protein